MPEPKADAPFRLDIQDLTPRERRRQIGILAGAIEVDPLLQADIKQRTAALLGGNYEARSVNRGVRDERLSSVWKEADPHKIATNLFEAWELIAKVTGESTS